MFKVQMQESHRGSQKARAQHLQRPQVEMHERRVRRSSYYEPILYPHEEEVQGANLQDCQFWITSPEEKAQARLQHVRSRWKLQLREDVQRACRGRRENMI